MPHYFLILSFILLATIVVGFQRIVRGPSPTDCMLAVLFFCTTGVGVLILMTIAFADSRLIDVALVFALLSAVVGATYVRLGWLSDIDRKELGDE